MLISFILLPPHPPQHSVTDSTMVAAYDELIVDIDAPSELEKILSTTESTTSSRKTSTTSNLVHRSTTSSSIQQHEHAADGSCCDEVQTHIHSNLNFLNFILK